MKEKSLFMKRENKNISNARYIDNNELKYSLRSLEKYMPWVNKIYIVTHNQTPKCLNINHPKIVMVNHCDIFQDTIYPNYNAAAIEMNIHHIKGLQENFIYFNDDFFIGKALKEKDFFF